MTTEYRFFETIGPTGFRANVVQGTPPTASPGNFDLRNQYNQSVMLGVRYAFNVAPPPAPAPAPAAAPAPAPARSYLVFFDWDRADLTDRGRQIIREAAENSTRVQYTRIEVNGYTDTFGGRRPSPPSWSATGCRATRSRCRASAKRTSWSRPRPVCASRRTGEWRSSSGKRGYGAETLQPGRAAK